MMRAILVACLLCLSVAAFAGQPDAYSAGMKAEMAHDYPVAHADFRLAAKQGYAPAQYHLGEMYETGRGVPLDRLQSTFAMANKWFRLAAKQGYAPAQLNLALNYAGGAGVPQDYAKSLKWTRLAAQQGNAFAQYCMGLIYYHGQGVPQEYTEAYKWFVLAKVTSKNVDGLASRYMHRLEAMMTPTQIAQAQQEASAWWAVHHKGGN
jgi:TPR repeat protein